MTAYERVQAGRIHVGDRGRAYAHRHVPDGHQGWDTTAVAVWLHYEDGTRDRPGQTGRWWREV